MSESMFKAISCHLDQVGKHIKGSKKRYIWKFSINQTINIVQCDFSIVSGKIKVACNGRLISDADLTKNNDFKLQMLVQGINLTVIQNGIDFELRANGQSMNHMVNQQKTLVQFNKDQLEDIKVDQSLLKNNSGKAVTLNIKGIGNGMKKKKCIQSQEWKQIALEDIQYFKKLYDLLPANTYEQNVEFLQRQKIQLSPEQFRTMQQLFTTQHLDHVQVQESEKPVQVQESEKPVQVHEPEKPVQVHEPQKSTNAMNLIDNFNTMQNLFATSNISGLQIGNTPATILEQKKEEFCTMQQLFATQKNTLQVASSQAQPKVQDNFNTMQNLFKTLNIPQLQQIANSGPTKIINSQPCTTSNQLDFNTMQQLFQTSGISKPWKPLTASQMKKQQLPNIDDFSTMPNLFRTNNINLADFSGTAKPQKHQQNVPPTVPDPINKTQVDNNSDFNTMQNLFMTKNPFSSTAKNPDQGALGEINNINNINMVDFNTMQNLFRTINANNSQ